MKVLYSQHQFGHWHTKTGSSTPDEAGVCEKNLPLRQLVPQAQVLIDTEHEWVHVCSNLTDRQQQPTIMLNKRLLSQQRLKTIETHDVTWFLLGSRSLSVCVTRFLFLRVSLVSVLILKSSFHFLIPMLKICIMVATKPDLCPYCPRFVALVAVHSVWHVAGAPNSWRLMPVSEEIMQ